MSQKKCHQALHSKAFLIHETSKEDLERDQALRSLLTLRYYLDYGDGDYVGESCREFRDKAIAAQTTGQEIFTGKTWSEVDIELQNEAELVKQWYYKDRKATVPETPTTNAINTACANGNYDITQIRYSISWYAKRNEQAHNGVAQMIQRCDFEKLGNRLFSDLNSIPRVLGVPDQAMMEKVLKHIRNRFFVEVRQEDSVLSDHALEMIVRREHGKATKVENARQDKKPERVSRPGGSNECPNWINGYRECGRG